MRLATLLLLASLNLPAEVPAPSFERLPDGRVTLASEAPGAIIRYTFEDKDPDRSAGAYLAPVSIPAGFKLKARAFSADSSDHSLTLIIAGLPEPTTLTEVTQNRDWKNYDWVQRHEAILKLGKANKPDLLFIGDSITHFWGGEPFTARRPGAAVWDKYFATRNALNLGYGWDRTENVLWRLRHGEVDGLSPRAVVIMIGTNNAGINTVDEITQGITAICDELHARLPKANLLLLGIFPRGAKPNDARTKVMAVNQQIAKLNGRHGVTYLDIGKVFLEPDVSIAKEIMDDYLHPTAAGYERWAAAMEPTLQRLLAK